MTADLDIRLTVTDGQVTGTLTDDALRLTVVKASWSPPRVEPCPQGGRPGLIGDGSPPSGIYDLGTSLAMLRRAPDGAYRYDRTETIAAHAPFTVESHVVVRFPA
jgi:hypothetical protein